MTLDRFLVDRLAILFIYLMTADSKTISPKIEMDSLDDFEDCTTNGFCQNLSCAKNVTTVRVYQENIDAFFNYMSTVENTKSKINSIYQKISDLQDFDRSQILRCVKNNPGKRNEVEKLVDNFSSCSENLHHKSKFTQENVDELGLNFGFCDQKLSNMTDKIEICSGGGGGSFPFDGPEDATKQKCDCYADIVKDIVNLNKYRCKPDLSVMEELDTIQTQFEQRWEALHVLNTNLKIPYPAAMMNS